jgi:hypothetical protein
MLDSAGAVGAGCRERPGRATHSRTSPYLASRPAADSCAGAALEAVTFSSVVSAELRAAEREIDSVYRGNALVAQPFSQAAWRFLAVNEERVMREVVRTGETGTSHHDHYYAALFDDVVVSTKWPMRWLLADCRPGERIPRQFDDAAYVAANALSELGRSYLHFEGAFTYASLGALTLTVEGRSIRASNEFRGGTRYDAYDRLRQPRMPDTPLGDVDRVIGRLRPTVRIKGQLFSYDAGPRMVAAALEALSPLIDSRFALPSDWAFRRFSLNDFRSVARVLWTLAYLHFNARIIAAGDGCVGLGYARALYVKTRHELVAIVRDHTQLTRNTVADIVDTLTLGHQGQRSPDPALQPIVPLTTRHIAIAPNLVINSALERNLTVLLNRLPEEKAQYAVLSKDRETTSRQRIIRVLKDLGFRYWFGRISEWGTAGEVDLVIVSDAEQCCLALETKAFIGPADPREVHERSMEIARGIEQAVLRRSRTVATPGPLMRALGTVNSYEVTWAVASETSIGAPYVQSDDMPVIQTQHLLDKLSADGRLAMVCQWLKCSNHLPIEGRHYETVDFVATLGDWSLPWYGLRALVSDYV